MTAGQVSDYTGAAALLDGLPKAQWLLGDRTASGKKLRKAAREAQRTAEQAAAATGRDDADQ